jgi:ubiquinone/menaquinone biosynthesis C-methylase UbiE
VKDFIKEYWENQAKTHGNSHCASWGDNFMIDLETETIGAHITAEADVLDVGCANGFSSFCQIEKRNPKSLVGVDFSENMIAEANRSKAFKKLGDNVAFEAGDVRALRFDDNSFDVVYTTRVLINLPTWEEQMKGVDECVRVARKGGKVILSEAFWEPLVLLNAMRALEQLEPLVEHDFNRYLKKSKLEEYLNGKGLKFIVDEFSAIYYLGSRFLRDLATDTSKYPGYTNPINEIFYNIEKRFSGGRFGIQQAYIITK